MIPLDEPIEKARERSRGFDLQALAERGQALSVGSLASEEQLARRRRFLSESLRDEAEAQKAFERIILGNELQDANYLARGARAAKAVARIRVVSPAGRLSGYGTGFLIAPGVLITNNHVLPSGEIAAGSVAEFRYELDLEGRPQPGIPFALRPDRLFVTSRPLDFSVVAVEPRSGSGANLLTDFGFLPLVATLGKVAEGEWLTIVQHPGGERKQVCVRENRLLRIASDVLWYSTDTLGGSSGSPVHNNDWYVVALHHSGVPSTDAAGRILKLDGRVFDDAVDDEKSIKWVANEGIRVSRIIEELTRQHRGHPLLAPVFSATPESARIRLPQSPPSDLAAVRPLRPSAAFPPETPMNSPNGGERLVHVTLAVATDGSVRVASGAAAETSLAAASEAARASSHRPPTVDVPFDPDYSRRKGFDEAFLGTGARRVLLPRLSPRLAKAAARHIEDPQQYVLHYLNYSVVMHAERRLAIYTAANVDCDNRFQLSRTTDTWRTDPRIPTEHQLSEFYYRDNQFDRGHLTRREDLEFGSRRSAALASAGDTCHYTNCVPQHERFNRNKETWHGLELHILERAVKQGAFRAQVFTGPLLAEDDPVWARFPKIQYPVRFWKVVVALNARGELFATGFILDQSEAIQQHGIEAMADAPIGAFKDYQVSVAEIERETGLTFLRGKGANGSEPLSAVDPLPNSPRGPQRPRLRREEALGIVGVQADYRYLESPEDIYLGED